MSNIINTSTQPCAEFVEDLSSFVDGELEPTVGAAEGSSTDPVQRLVQHMGGCAGCHDYTMTLREFSKMHRSAVGEEAEFPVPGPVPGPVQGMDDIDLEAEQDQDGAALGALESPAEQAATDAETVGQVDPLGVLASVSKTLVSEKRGTLARLFYEVGKAYALAGNRALQEKRRQSVMPATAPQPLRATEARAHRELKDTEALHRMGGQGSGTGMLLRRSRQLFGSPRRGSATLTRARRFLEEALALDPTLDEARLYLGFRHATVGRVDRARIQFRKVYLEGRTPLLKLLGVQSLGRLHAEGGDYRRAIECYEEVVSSPLGAKEVGLFPSFLNLAVNYAKAGEIDKSVETFADLACRFPKRLPQIRDLLARKSYFQSLLDRNLTMKQTLASRAPALFAA